MVDATPKEIAMARQTANSESHILQPPILTHSIQPKKTSEPRIEIINSRCHFMTGMSSNQQRVKTTGPAKLASLAQPMMFNDASGKVPGDQWSCGREAAVRTTFVASVCRRIIVLGSRRGFDTMLPLPFGASIKF